MTYAVNPVVTINDVVYSDIAINGITLTNGRTTVDEQPRAGYATISLVTPDNNSAPIEIDQRVVVKVDDSSGSDVTLWTGWVSDVETSLLRFGETGWLNQQQVTAIGTLSKLNRRIVGGAGYPQEFDGDRIAAILNETAGITWAEYSPPTDTWDDVDSLLQWQNVDILIGDIDQPGDFELAAFTGSATSGLSLAQIAAASGLGVLYETADGRISYKDYSSRLDDVALNGFTDIANNAILSQGLSSVTRLGDLANDVTVNYDGGEEQDEDATSIAVYGRYAGRVDTILANQVDAEQRVEYYLETRAFPRRELNTVNLVLHIDDVADALRDSLLPMVISKPIRIDSLPQSIYPSTFAGFVEGFTWTINRNELFLTLNISEFAFSQLQMNWLQVPGNLAWEDVSATLEWQEARVVA